MTTATEAVQTLIPLQNLAEGAPKANAPRQAIKGIEVIALDRIEQAIEQMRNW